MGWDVNGFRRNQAELKRFFNMNADTFEFVLMHDKGKKYLLELTEKRMVDITDYNSELANFLIEELKDNYALFEITPADLPFIMAIKEDLCYDPDLSYMHPSDRDEERYYITTGVPFELRSEYQWTKKHEANNEIVKPMDDDKKEQLWNEFATKDLSDDEFWVEYYKLLMLFGHDVEELYLNASEDKKNFVIEAYHYYSSDADVNKHFRVSSPIINEEVLKLKHLKNN